MAVKIRLKRMGKIRQPYYRVVVVDSRKKRDGRVIEEIGKYHPKEDPSYIDVASERAQYWLGVGAQPSEAVAAILKITGDWQQFKGLPGAEGTLRVREAKRDKTEIFNEALKDSAGESRADAVTKKAAKKASKSEAKAEPEPEAKAEPETKAEPEAKPKPKAKAEPKTEAAPEVEVEETPAAEAAPEVKVEETPAEETPAAEAAPEAEETPVTTEAAADAEKTEKV